MPDAAGNYSTMALLKLAMLFSFGAAAATLRGRW